jgi:hypothetical protein
LLLIRLVHTTYSMALILDLASSKGILFEFRHHFLQNAKR